MSISLPIQLKSCIFLLTSTYKILSNIALVKLTHYDSEITEDYLMWISAH